MKVALEDKARLRSEPSYMLKKILTAELELTKNELLVYKKDNREYDLILQGRGTLIKELLELLGD